MINIILFGPPGSGKGTQADLLVKKFNLEHISTGDLFRFNIKNETELGKEAKKYMDQGKLVPDEVTINMLKARVNESPDSNGFIFDGFPRTILQAEELNSFLAKKNTKISALLSLSVTDEELINRLLNRGKTSGRSDDMDKSVIKNRIKVYYDQTSPVYDFYDKFDKSFKINGTGTIEQIGTRLADKISTL